MKEKMKVMPFRLPESLHGWIKEQAFKTNQSMNKIILEAVIQAKEAHEKKDK